MMLPSHDEGLPFALIEAMACGMAVISTKVGGIPELVVSKANGLLIEPGDVHGLKDAMEILVREKTTLKDMAASNIDRIRHFYTLDKIFTLLSRELNDYNK